MRSKHSWLTHKFVETDTSVLQNKFSQGSIKKWENFGEIPSLEEHLFMAVRESFKTQFVPDLQIIVLLLFVVPHTHICASKFCTRPPKGAQISTSLTRCHTYTMIRFSSASLFFAVSLYTFPYLKLKQIPHLPLTISWYCNIFNRIFALYCTSNSHLCFKLLYPKLKSVPYLSFHNLQCLAYTSNLSFFLSMCTIFDSIFLRPKTHDCHKTDFAKKKKQGKLQMSSHLSCIEI